MPCSLPPLRLLLLSTPVGPLGSGLGGGVELTLKNMAGVLQKRGHSVCVVAPEGSVLPGIVLEPIAGQLQETAQTQSRDTPITMQPNSVLAEMWDYARRVENSYDLIVNFGYDWLPFYLTPFFSRPIAHLVSMGSLSTAMDQAIERVVLAFPGTIGVHSRTQAATFGFAHYCRPLGNGLDLSLYQFQEKPDKALAWVGRISPEKALEDGVAAAQKTGLPLKILGKIQDQRYWQWVQQTYPQAPISYMGFRSTTELQEILRSCRALLMTPRWVEAFGNVAIEALACGVPVIAYDRGGPAEIIRDGITGWLVEPDSVVGLVAAIARIDEIDRRACRLSAEKAYSLEAWGDRLEAWFEDILNRWRSRRARLQSMKSLSTKSQNLNPPGQRP